MPDTAETAHITAPRSMAHLLRTTLIAFYQTAIAIQKRKFRSGNVLSGTGIYFCKIQFCIIIFYRDCQV